MKAQNLTISVPSPNGCNKKCPYCVSDMTGHVKHNWELMQSKFEKVKTLAMCAQVNNVMLTSKGEPLLNPEHLLKIAEKFNDFPLEIQTNGILLLEKNIYSLNRYGYPKILLGLLKEYKIDVIAISIDKAQEFEDRREAIKKAIEMDFVVRICVNLNKFLGKYRSVGSVFEYARELGVQQLLFREITIPEGKSNDWIDLHANLGWFNDIDVQLLDIISDNELKPMRTLVTGEQLYEWEGVSFVHSKHCIQERSNGEDDIRSLIFLEDGHVYTSWNSKAPLL